MNAVTSLCPPGPNIGVHSNQSVPLTVSRERYFLSCVLHSRIKLGVSDKLKLLDFWVSDINGLGCSVSPFK